MSVSAIMGLAHLVPGLVRLFQGDKAGDVAQKAVDVAKVITGTESPEEAAQQIKNDPALLVKYQEAMNPIVIAELEAEAAKLESVNQTIRAEYNQDDLYTKRWRPTYGYCAAITWTLQMLGLTFIVGWAVIAAPKDAPGVIAAIAGMLSPLMVLWGVALAVLGVSVAARSQDKANKLGQQSKPGILSSIAQRIGGNRDNGQ